MTNIPDGWEATEYRRGDGRKVAVDIDGKWVVLGRYGWVATRYGSHDTPSAAIAALEEAEKC